VCARALRDTQHERLGRESAPSTNGQPSKGAGIIADYLIGEQMPYLFALCGHGNVGMLDALLDRRDQISVVSVHHETVAGFMADAFFRVSGSPVATLTSCGPGSANLPIALANALMDGSAFLAITGNVPTTQFNRAPFQESGYHYQADFTSVVRPYVKRSFQATRPEQLPVALRQAFTLMSAPPPGPVHLDVPLDVFVEEAAVPDAGTARWSAGISLEQAAPHELVEIVVEQLRNSSRPLFLAGRGVLAGDASSELLAIARHLGVPVAWTPDGKGVADSADPLAIGETGRNGTLPANRAASASDLIVALCPSFDDRASSSWIPESTFTIPPTRLVHVAMDRRDLGRNYAPTIGIAAHPKVFLRQLRTAIECDAGQWSMAASGGPQSRWSAWRDQVAAWRAEWDSLLDSHSRTDATPIKPARLLDDVRRVLDDDAILVSDVGLHHNWIVQRWSARSPNSLLHSWGFGAMGFGVAGSLGAKLAAPSRPVVAVVGDGGFLMFPSVVSTAVEYGIPVVWLIWNNRGYLSIRDIQRAYFGAGREFATEFQNPDGTAYTPDFAAMARSMGADAATVEKPADLPGALEAAVRSGRPWVLDVAVAGDEAPVASGAWDLPPLPIPMPNFLDHEHRAPRSPGATDH
jgi:acetolactate synthase-1/2/3 large subunit